MRAGRHLQPAAATWPGSRAATPAPAPASAPCPGRNVLGPAFKAQPGCEALTQVSQVAGSLARWCWCPAVVAVLGCCSGARPRSWLADRHPGRCSTVGQVKGRVTNERAGANGARCWGPTIASGPGPHWSPVPRHNEARAHELSNVVSDHNTSTSEGVLTSTAPGNCLFSLIVHAVFLVKQLFSYILCCSQLAQY